MGNNNLVEANTAVGNSNGIVDTADYVLWRKAAASGSGTVVASIPEPTTLLLLLGSMFAACAVRRSPRRG